MHAYKKSLQNGVRLITVPMKDATAVAVYILVEAGTNYETKNQNGISHFLEHVCFKGTEKRPRSIDIHNEFDNIGAQSNAFTSNEFTGYYAKSHPKHVAKIIDILSDIYLNSTFPKTEIEKEKGVIIEEINMSEDLPMRKAGRLYNELIYGDQPAGWSVLGRKEIIQGITPDDFRKYRTEHYVAGSTIVVVAGKFDQKKVEILVKKALASISKTKNKSKQKTVDNQKSSQVLLYPKTVDQAHIVIGVRTFGTNDKRMPALNLMNTILGEGMSSRLFQKLREEMGVCYYVHSYANEYTDYGDLSVSAGVDPNRVLEVTKVIIDEFKKLRDVTVSREELEKAKELSVGNLYLSLETSDALAGFYGIEEVLRGKLETPAQQEKKIRAVTAKEIQNIARDIFKNNRLNLVVVGKTPDKKDAQAILKI